MVIERISKEVIIRLTASVSTEDLWEFLDRGRNEELSKGYKTNQRVMDVQAAEVDRTWWAKKRKRRTK